MNSVNELKRAEAGDPKAIEKLCLATWESLYRFIYYKVQNRQEAEDITQETYVKILTHWQGHEASRENLPGLLKTVALNILRDRWRQRQRREIPVNLEAINSQEAAGLDHQRAVAQRLQLENAMAKLSQDQRLVLDLRIIKGYSVAETAKLAGKTEGAVRTAQYRALQALGQFLGDSD